MPSNKKGLWLNIDDKIEISETRYCPPHTFPHRFPWQDKIDDEPCHFHTAKWRMAHHIFYCKLLKCPNYSFMMEEYRKAKEKSSYLR